METINNLTNAASKAIWGEGQSHEEPVSGKMGNVAAGEPYDAGNIGGKFNYDRFTQLHGTYLLFSQSGILKSHPSDQSSQASH
jgi:hypothetical protein